MPWHLPQGVAEKRPLTRVKDREDKLKDLRANPAKFNEIVAQYAKKTRGLDAPAAAIEAIRLTLDTPIDEAQKKSATFPEAVVGDQSKAQRHIFFAEREANKVPGISKDVQPREIKRVAVIGAGTMGGGISMNFANVGIPVTIIENDEAALKRGMATIEKNYQMSVQRGRSRRRTWQAPRTVHTDDRPQCAQGRRHRDRGGVREHAGQEGTVRQARKDRQGRRRPRRPIPLISTSTRSRARPTAFPSCSACIS